MTLATITGRTDRQTDRRTDRQTDRVRRNMRPPPTPREEGRITIPAVCHSLPLRGNPAGKCHRRAWQKKTTNKSIVPSRTMRTGIVTHAHYAGGVSNYLNSNHTKYLAQLCGRFFLRFWKFPPPIWVSSGATYRRNYETFSTSGPLTNSEKTVQIDA